ncbi:MAG: thiamine-phosphate kinase [Acidobacteria bacterium]|nr:thiamine-phosphate kinase [Acidobacteriota bacterium]
MWKNEFDFERFLRRMRFSGRGVPVGIGDDAAVLPDRGRQRVLTTDMMVENVHFRRATCAPEWLAHKLLARNVSDVAAMGGTPTHYLVSVAVPSSLSEDFLPRFYCGLQQAQRRMRVRLVGGDLSRSPSGVIFSSIALLGELMYSPLLRAGAKLHDSLWVTGSLGRSAAALSLLEQGMAVVDTAALKFRSAANCDRARERDLHKLMRAHFLPEPRVSAALWLAKHGIASAAIDISDGLSTDLNRLCAASRVGAVVRLDDLPVSRPVRRWVQDPIGCALHGGEDYELLFTVPAGAERKLSRLPGRVPVRRIGQIVSRKRGVQLEAEGRLGRLGSSGFDHFQAG